jgi:hypothetical protein
MKAWRPAPKAMTCRVSFPNMAQPRALCPCWHSLQVSLRLPIARSGSLAAESLGSEAIRDRLRRGAARSSDLDFARGETPKLLGMARSPASALPARPSVLHRCSSSRRCGNCGRTGSRRPGGWRTRRGVRTLVDRRGHGGCRRPGSRRCCPPSHPGRWAQASFLKAGAGDLLWPTRIVRLVVFLGYYLPVQFGLCSSCIRRSAIGATVERK